MMKRLSYFLSLALLALLAGCGGGGSGSGGGPDVPPDTDPDGLQFQSKVNATRGGWAVSDPVIISGINAAAPIRIENGEYAIDAGDFTSAAGTINNGQSLTIRVMAADVYSRITRAVVTIGSVTVEFEVTSELPDYVPDSVVDDGQGTLYLLNAANSLVFRWSIADERYLDAIAVGTDGVAPSNMAYSNSQQRLYLGYSSGAIQYIDTAAQNGIEVPFGNTPMAVEGLAAVGNFLLAQDASGAWATHYIFDAGGTITHQLDWNYYSREYAWDPVTSRVYFFRDEFGPNDLHFEVINQASGQITDAGETPYHGDYNIEPPIRVSPDGQHVLLGSGDIYNQSDLTWAGSVGGALADARWMADGSLVTLTTSGNQTTLHRLGSASLTHLEQLSYSGVALRVVGSDTGMVVLVIDNGTVQFHTYVPNDDSDGDGIPNTEDAFPLDPAASVDSDHDGYPDAWNPGMSEDDSTTGLVLDAYPQDSACYLPEHGDGVTCNYGATIPSYVPDQVISQGDTIYLLSSVNRRVYRWSIASGSYLNPYVVGIDQGFTTLAPTQMAYSSAHQRLYLGYSNGAIQYIDTSVQDGAEVAFGNTAMGVGGLAAIGNFLLAQDFSGAWATHYIFNAAGTITHQLDWNYYSREYAWDPVTSRVYFFRDDTSPNDLHFEVINQASGQITGAGETPYHGSYSIEPPIRVSVDGQYVLLGSGDLYSQSDLTWAGSLGQSITDARWLADGTIVTLTTSGNQTTLHRLGSASLTHLEQLSYSGTALRVVGADTGMVVLVIDNGTVQFHPYMPNDDSDGDGVPNTEDAFPLDPAASVDTDHDGYPDAWNPGMSQSDSTTGLSLDAYPNDAACYLPEHGDGVTCNYGATIPSYVPDQVLSDGDTIYLLSSGNRRVYRWSIASGSYLNPYVIGIDQGFSVTVPDHMAYSSAHQRLYLGYSNGAIHYIDTSTPNGAEVPFAATALGVGGLAAVGNFLLAQDFSGAWATHYIFNAAGHITHQLDWNYYSREYAWDPVYSRVYFFRDDTSPDDLHFEVINQASGQITDAGETPYHGSYSIEPPIRVSADGQHVLLGSGDLYNQSDLTWAGSLGQSITDARWLADGSIVTLTTSGNQTTLRRLSDSLTNLEQLSYSGVGLRVVGSDTGMVVLVIDDGTVQFHTYVPNDDSDGDGVPNNQDAFPLDPAASVDTDHDGYPDAWNPGMSQDDSTTGLVLDAYPNDAACYLPEHGDGVTCNYGATVPNFVPDQIISDGDTIYLLSSGNRRVYRRSIATGNYLNPYVIGIEQGFSVLVPDHMTYSGNQQRLYLGYSTGAIRYIDTSAPNGAETDFANTALGVGGLAAVGNFLLAQDFSGAWATHYIFNAAGNITHQLDWNYYSREYAWDPVYSRVYFFRDDTSPDDLHFEVINQASGQITDAGETPYHGSYGIEPPIRVSQDGQHVLLGTGDIYNQADLTWAGSLGQTITDARWLADGSIVTLTTSGGQTTVRRLSGSLVNLEQLSYDGVGLRVVGSDTGMVVIVIDNGTVQFHPYVPNDDSDGDGVPNIDDAFPLDPAASVDSDHDGYPDAWNPGMGPGDSTTELTLDAYPNDAACYLPEHGDGVTCDPGATIPNYVPDQVLSDGDTIYLLSSANRRVYRWSIATASYLNPYVIGIDQGFSTLAPDHMAYSSSQQRLYLGYSTGAIRFIDTSVPNGAETDFANTALGVSGLAAVGNFLLAQDFSGAWATHYIFDATGNITHQLEWNYYSREYAWDPVFSRVYFFRDDTSPDDLHFEVINQASGQITAAGETPYHGDYSIEPPIRVSPDGQRVLLGSGDFYKKSNLTWVGSLGQSITDAEWKDNLLVDIDASGLLEIRDAVTRDVLTSYQYSGQPIRLAFGQADAYLVRVKNNKTAFVKLPFGDQDQDSIPQWWEELYGLSDSNAADAAEDPDGDGADNATEYMNHTNPLVP